MSDRFVCTRHLSRSLVLSLSRTLTLSLPLCHTSLLCSRASRRGRPPRRYDDDDMDDDRPRRRDDEDDSEEEDEDRRRRRVRRKHDADSDDDSDDGRRRSRKPHDNDAVDRRAARGGGGGGSGYGGGRGGRGGGGYGYENGYGGGGPGPGPADDRGPCWDFMRGRCTRGIACRFSHAGGGGSAGGYDNHEPAGMGGKGGWGGYGGGYGKGGGEWGGGWGGFDGKGGGKGGGFGKGGYGGKGGGYGFDGGWGYGKGGGEWDGGYGKGGGEWEGGWGGFHGKGGGKGGGKGWGRGGGGPPPPMHHDYRRMEGDTARVDVRRVDELLSMRVAAKRAGDFRAADAIRKDLQRQCNVAVLDREREWHVIGSEGLGRPDGESKPYGGYGGAHNMAERFGERGHDYKRGDDGAAEVDDDKVNELLAARLHARLNRDFVAADKMRDQLRTEHGVEVLDQEREWRVAALPSSSAGAADGADGAPQDEPPSRYDRSRGEALDEDEMAHEAPAVGAGGEDA